MTATVLKFSPRDEPNRLSETETTLGSLSSAKAEFVQSDDAHDTPVRRRLTFDDLYPETDRLSATVVEARKLIRGTVQRLEQAIAAANSDDLIAADDALNHAIASCARVFHFRSLGDGFGMIANGALAAMENISGRSFHVRQVVAIKALLEALSLEPYISADDASLRLETSESAGIQTEPAGTEVLLDWLVG